MPRETFPQLGHSRNLRLRSRPKGLKPYPRPPRPRAIKLRKINHLPHPQAQLPLFQRPSQVIPQHRRLQMSRRVPFPMPIIPILPRHRPLQRHRQIPPYIRIRPLLNRYRRRGVRNDNVQKPIPPPPLGGSLLQRLCYGHKFGMAFCANDDFF